MRNAIHRIVAIPCNSQLTLCFFFSLLMFGLLSGPDAMIGCECDGPSLRRLVQYAGID